MFDIEKNLPTQNTKLSDMSFAQIKAVAASGKATEYGIIEGKQINVNKEIKAEIVNIGDTYIEFMTTTPVIKKEINKEKILLQNNKKISLGSASSFYRYPQINIKDRIFAPVCFVGSCIQKELDKWFENQSKEFKEAIKDTERVYNIASLNYKNKYKQLTNSIAEEIEKVYIPTLDEIEFIVDNSVTWDNEEAFWTASPCNINTRSSKASFGYFYIWSRNHLARSFGNEHLSCVAMFRIG